MQTEGLHKHQLMCAGFPGVNVEFQELVKACAEAALETDDRQLKTKVTCYQLHM